MENVKTCFAFFSYAPNCNFKTSLNYILQHNYSGIYSNLHRIWPIFVFFVLFFVLFFSYNFVKDVITWVLAEEDGRILKHDMTMINK
jgi:hypothetical protein